ncbi:MAG: hypothetical protein HWE21_18665, partial [Cytophagia bacterium]|nr:hypothetical protein [Cytophagia bacterium]
MKQKRVIILLCFFFSTISSLLGQSIGIGKVDFTPDSAAILELKSDNQGLLIPRLTINQKESIQNPPIGLLIFQVEEPIGFHFFTSSGWSYLVDNNVSQSVNFQQLNFDSNSGILSLENGGSIDLSQYLSGRKILNGPTPPSASTGSNGDFYFNTKDKEFYGPKTAGAWGTATSLVGPAGVDGINGTDGVDGVDGVDGKTILNGTTDPTSTDGVDGDFFLNTITYDLFGPKTAGAWGTAKSLVGPAGANGADGADGVDGINGTNGTDGIDGADGADGLDGKTVLNGTIDPTSTDGVDGDFFLNTITYDLFGPKTAGVWGTAKSLVGPAGANGADGADGINGTNGTDGVDGVDGADGTDGLDGKTILNGTTDPNSTDGVDGDFYLNTITYDLFGPKTAGVWGSAKSLVGPAGANGADGADGADGVD